MVIKKTIVFTADEVNQRSTIDKETIRFYKANEKLPEGKFCYVPLLCERLAEACENKSSFKIVETIKKSGSKNCRVYARCTHNERNPIVYKKEEHKFDHALNFVFELKCSKCETPDQIADLETEDPPIFQENQLVHMNEDIVVGNDVSVIFNNVATEINSILNRFHNDCLISLNPQLALQQCKDEMIQQVSQAISLQVERNSDQMIADLFDQNDLEEQLIVVAKNSERRSDVGLEQINVQQQQIIENREENDVENKTDQQNEENFLNSNENVGQTKSKGLTPRALAKRAERAIKEAFQPTPKRSKKRRRLF